MTRSRLRLALAILLLHATSRRACSADLLWNSPFPEQCAGPGARRAQNASYFARFGIRANQKADFNGDVVTTIYTPGNVTGHQFTFGLWPHFDKTGSAVHGGIPQRGNLTAHLVSVSRAIEVLFPDKEHSGYIVVDWELWYPWLIPESHSIYVNESIRFANGDIDLAIQQWNASSLAFMTETIELAVRMRPNAHWGYYGRPGCYTGWRNISEPPGCWCSVEARNDALMPLWEAQTALYPSVYIGTNPVYGNKTRTPRFVADEIDETMRVKHRMKNGDAVKVYAFVWYDLFNSPCAQYGNCSQITDLKDLSTEFAAPLKYGADGLILWGSSGDANSKAKCTRMENYVESTLGPFLRNISALLR